jgi:hemolysin activation/secretion protein
MMGQMMGSGLVGRRVCALSLAAMLVGLTAVERVAAQQAAPDAGQTLEQLRTPPAPPAPTRDFRVELPPEGRVEPGGEQVVVNRVVLDGNTAFDRATLLAVIGDPEGQAFDLAGLQEIAFGLSEFYRANGYPFARALIPPQTMAEGVLQVVVIEGRYGTLGVVDDNPRRARQAEGFLGLLQPGEVIAARPLERTTLLLEDLPGIRVLPVLRPGEAVGTGDLEFVIQAEPRFRGSVTADNHGNRYTGYERGQVALTVDSPFRLGDQLTLSTLYTREKLALGSVGYSRPLGGGGLRGTASYTYTEYRLAREFDGLGRGDARITSLGLSYPLLRSQQSNVTLTVSAQYKDLFNDRLEGTLIEDYSSVALPLSVQFDRRDDVVRGGVTYGSLSINPGRMSLSGSMRETDALGTHGSFLTFNADLARLQVLAPSLTVFGRLSGQWTTRNLDSSEGISLGGAERVRAYPASEASGDRGGYAQLEVRYARGRVAPYLFVDAGRVEFDARPLDAAEEAARTLAGYGLGVRVQQGQGLNVNAAVAWRLTGGESRADVRDREPLYWLNVGYRF